MTDPAGAAAPGGNGVRPRRLIDWDRAAPRVLGAAVGLLSLVYYWRWGLDFATYWRAGRVQKMGLALTGFTQFVNLERLQILGKTEMVYLGTLGADRQRQVIQEICRHDIACLVVTRSLEVPDLLLQEADRAGIPLFRTNLMTTDFMTASRSFWNGSSHPPRASMVSSCISSGLGCSFWGKAGSGRASVPWT